MYKCLIKFFQKRKEKSRRKGSVMENCTGGELLTISFHNQRNLLFADLKTPAK